MNRRDLIRLAIAAPAFQGSFDRPIKHGLPIEPPMSWAEPCSGLWTWLPREHEVHRFLSTFLNHQPCAYEVVLAPTHHVLFAAIDFSDCCDAISHLRIKMPYTLRLRAGETLAVHWMHNAAMPARIERSRPELVAGWRA